MSSLVARDLNVNNLLDQVEELGRRLDVMERQAKTALELDESGLVDYSDKSTITGWSSFTTKNLFYLKMNNILVVMFLIQGTSSTTGVSFTLPNVYTGPGVNVAIQIMDNGAAGTGYAALTKDSATVQCFKDMTGSGFTNSGTKLVTGALVMAV